MSLALRGARSCLVVVGSVVRGCVFGVKRGVMVVLSCCVRGVRVNWIMLFSVRSVSEELRLKVSLVLFWGGVMRDYPNKEGKGAPARPQVRPQVPVHVLTELARQAKMLGDEWVQSCLFALSMEDDADLSEAVLAQLRVQVLIETLDPYPFDIPSEESAPSR